MKLRQLTPSDTADLLKLSAAAGWNQTCDDWGRLLRLEPGGCFGIEDAGHVVASATVVKYGTTLAWIGMVLTLPEYRGRGFAGSLMAESLGYCGDLTVRLDASDMGKPMYERLGFVSECYVDRWKRDPAAGEVEPFAAGELKLQPPRDREVFGADRSALLKELSAYETASCSGAYAFGRPGSLACYFGPCVSEDARAAESLLRWFVGRHAGEAVFIDLFPHHRHSVQMAQALGFRPVRRLTRMVRQPAGVVLPDSRIYAIAGFEYG